MTAIATDGGLNVSAPELDRSRKFVSPIALIRPTIMENAPASMLELRAAFFTDTFDEPNGVATISQQFLRFANQHRVPLVLIRPGSQTRCTVEGNGRVIELAKSCVCLPLDMGLKFDLLTSRHLSSLQAWLEEFKPQVVHVSGPGDVGMLGASMAHRLRLPLVMSWHTNLHQYASLRWRKYFRCVPRRWAQQLELTTEHLALRAAARFYHIGDVVMAPNEEILATLTRLTGKPGKLMPHGVDCDRFQPNLQKPANLAQDRPFTIGYVGRLTPEKNVHVLADLEAELISRGVLNVRFMVVGEGSERASLAGRMTRAVFCGVLRDEALAEAYSQMDLFVFPSRSDTLGLVLLEAMAAGLAIIAFRTTGPGSVVHEAHTGFLVESVSEMAALVARLVLDNSLRLSLGQAARLQALKFSWDSVFVSCYEAYMVALEECPRSRGVPVQAASHF